MKDISYCLANKCYKKKECNRYIGNHIVQGVPRLFINEKECIINDYEMFTKKELNR